MALLLLTFLGVACGDPLLRDDECQGEQCALGLLQKYDRQLSTDWVSLIEGSSCTSAGGISCEQTGAGRHFKFPAGVFMVPRQVTVPANTIIEGAANPNPTLESQWEKPDYASQTVFLAERGVSDSGACYCQNRERSWEPLSPSNPYHCEWGSGRNGGGLTNEKVKELRPGFLMYSNTVVKNIAYQGKDTLRPADNGALCGGAVFETPGCVHNECLFTGEPGHEHVPILLTGDGKPVSHVTIENVRLNDYSSDPNLASQLAVWVAQTTHPEPTSNVKVTNLVAMFLHADGINFHGYVQDALVDHAYIQNTGDDIYAVWGSHFDTRRIKFENSIGVDAGRARDNHYGSCVAIYGAKEAKFENIQCWAPEQNTHDCYDAKNNGETCNGCLGIIKESFSADYSDSVFTFENNHFYQLKSEMKNGKWVYDLSDPQPNGRPEVCNNEWKKGGLQILGD